MSSPVGGFMPIPLAMMMPFMAAQSMLMGDAFGKGFQFGKRKISALSNEEFNSLTMSNMVSDMQTEFRELVPTLQQSIKDSKQVQNVIIEEMIKIVPEFLKFLTLGSVDALAHGLGTHAHTDTTTPPPSTPPPSTPPVQPTGGRVNPRQTTTTKSAPVFVKPTQPLTLVMQAKLRTQYQTTLSKLRAQLRDFQRILLSLNKNNRNYGRYEGYIQTVMTEITRQQQYLANVNRGQHPF